MNKYDKDSMGTRMKLYEQPSTARKAFKGQPLIARLDGDNFHAFTRGLKRPYDARLSDLMVETMMALVDRYQATIGYVQSDEISLAWYCPVDSSAEYPLGGRFQKLDSQLASYASTYFNQQLPRVLPDRAGRGKFDDRDFKTSACFDARSFVVPNLLEAYHAFLWRQQDCTKNAISMAAQSMFSHKRLQGLHGPEMQELMHKEHSVNFNDYQSFFKRGTFARRVKTVRELTQQELERIPELYRPVGPVERTSIQSVDIWLSKQEDPVSILFNGISPKAFQ
jgi:tRNA(His) 5'-end guanylyltransferase